MSCKDVRAQFWSERILCFGTSKSSGGSGENVIGDCVLLRLLEEDDAVAVKCLSRMDLCCGVIMH